MKKVIVLILTLSFLLTLTACDNKNNAEKQEVSYSFYGGNDYFTISNGLITLSETEDILEGGDLLILQPDLYTDAVSVKTSFYILKGEEKDFIMSNKTVYQEVGSFSNEDKLGTIAGLGLISKKIENEDELKEKLWFEFEIIDVNGEKNTQQLQLIVTE